MFDPASLKDPFSAVREFLRPQQTYSSILPALPGRYSFRVVGLSEGQGTSPTHSGAGIPGTAGLGAWLGHPRADTAACCLPESRRESCSLTKT